MRQVFTKENSSCHVFVRVMFDEVGSLLGQSKFEGLTLFRNVDHEGMDTVLVTVAHLKCPVEHAYMPNDPYTGRTAPLTSKVSFYIFIQQI